MRKLKAIYFVLGAATILFILSSRAIPVAKSSEHTDNLRGKVQQQATQEATESPTPDATASADGTTQPPTDTATEPLQIKVGIYLRSIEELDLNQGSFVA